MKKKQTAVDYLVKELSAILGPLETKPMQDLLMVDAINKAKQMEEEQIMDTMSQQLQMEVNASETQKYYKSKEVQDLDNPTDVVDEYKMKKELKIYRVEFKGMYPVGNCLVLAAFNQEQAEEMAKKTITHTTEMVVNEMTINEPQVIEYLSGDY